MNNIRQKNVIFGFRESNKIPYGTRDVRLVNNQVIDSINLNNSFQQLRDNDLFVENLLKCQDSFQPGPKAYNQDISRLNTDGRKYWNGADDPTADLSILQKTEKLPGDTVYQIPGTQGRNIPYIIKFMNMFFASSIGESDGKILSSDDGQSWGQLFNNISSFSYDKNEQNLFIGYTQDGQHRVGVLSASQTFNPGTGQTTVSYSIKQISQNDTFDSTPTAIRVNSSGDMFVGTMSGSVYKLHIGDDIPVDTKRFDQLHMEFYDGGPSRDFAFRDDMEYANGRVLASFGNTIAKSRIMQCLISNDMILDGVQTLDMAKVSNTIYSCGTYGVSAIGGNVICKYPTYKMFSYEEDEKHILYFASRNNSSDSNISVFQKGDGINISKVGEISATSSLFGLAVVKENPIVATEDGLWIIDTRNDVTKKIQETDGWSFPIMETTRTSNGNERLIYVNQVSGDQSLFAVYSMSNTSEGDAGTTFIGNEIASVEPFYSQNKILEFGGGIAPSLVTLVRGESYAFGTTEGLVIHKKPDNSSQTIPVSSFIESYYDGYRIEKVLKIRNTEYGNDKILVSIGKRLYNNWQMADLKYFVVDGQHTNNPVEIELDYGNCLDYRNIQDTKFLTELAHPIDFYVIEDVAYILSRSFLYVFDFTHDNSNAKLTLQRVVLCNNHPNPECYMSYPYYFNIDKDGKDYNNAFVDKVDGNIYYIVNEITGSIGGTPGFGALSVLKIPTSSEISRFDQISTGNDRYVFLESVRGDRSTRQFCLSTDMSVLYDRLICTEDYNNLYYGKIPTEENAVTYDMKRGNQLFVQMSYRDNETAGGDISSRTHFATLYSEPETISSDFELSDCRPFTVEFPEYPADSKIECGFLVGQPYFQHENKISVIADQLSTSDFPGYSTLGSLPREIKFNVSGDMSCWAIVRNPVSEDDDLHDLKIRNNWYEDVFMYSNGRGLSAKSPILTTTDEAALHQEDQSFDDQATYSEKTVELTCPGSIQKQSMMFRERLYYSYKTTSESKTLVFGISSQSDPEDFRDSRLELSSAFLSSMYPMFNDHVLFDDGKSVYIDAYSYDEGNYVDIDDGSEDEVEYFRFSNKGSISSIYDYAPDGRKLVGVDSYRCGDGHGIIAMCFGSYILVKEFFFQDKIENEIYDEESEQTKKIYRTLVPTQISAISEKYQKIIFKDLNGNQLSVGRFAINGATSTPFNPDDIQLDKYYVDVEFLATFTNSNSNYAGIFKKKFQYEPDNSEIIILSVGKDDRIYHKNSASQYQLLVDNTHTNDHYGLHIKTSNADALGNKLWSLDTSTPVLSVDTNLTANTTSYKNTNSRFCQFGALNHTGFAYLKGTTANKGDIQLVQNTEKKLTELSSFPSGIKKLQSAGGWTYFVGGDEYDNGLSCTMGKTVGQTTLFGISSVTTDTDGTKVKGVDSFAIDDNMTMFYTKVGDPYRVYTSTLSRNTLQPNTVLSNGCETTDIVRIPKSTTSIIQGSLGNVALKQGYGRNIYFSEYDIPGADYISARESYEKNSFKWCLPTSKTTHGIGLDEQFSLINRHIYSFNIDDDENIFAYEISANEHNRDIVQLSAGEFIPIFQQKLPVIRLFKYNAGVGVVISSNIYTSRETFLWEASSEQSVYLSSVETAPTVDYHAAWSDLSTQIDVLRQVDRNHGTQEYGITVSCKAQILTRETEFVLNEPQEIFSQSADIYGISPYSNGDALLVSAFSGNSVKDSITAKYVKSEGAIKNHSIGVIEYKNTDDIVYPPQAAFVTDNFDYILPVRNSTDNGHIFVVNGTQLFHSQDRGNLQDWTTEKDNILVRHPDVTNAFTFNNMFFILLEDKGIWIFSNIDKNYFTFEEINRPGIANANMNRFTQVSDNRFLLESDDGAMMVNRDQVSMASFQGLSVTSIRHVDFDVGDQSYCFAIGRILYSDKNPYRISTKSDKILQIPSETARINDILPKNRYEYILGTSDGIFATKYQYELSNNLTFFKEDQVNDIYEGLVGNISTDTETLVYKHETEMHGDQSIMDVINNGLEDVDFSTVPENWKVVSSLGDGTQIVENDIVSEIKFGTSDDTGISVFTHNFIKDDTPRFDYIAKRYSSGMTELYILVDTTNTYYISHVPGAGYSRTGGSVSYSQCWRKNLERFGRNVANLKWEDGEENPIDKFKTTVSVVLEDNEYFLSDIMECQVNGCSLPLKIYPDIDGADIMSNPKISGMYQSLILPTRVVANENGSLVKRIDLGNDISCSAMKFECFGTDQQSIRLSFYDSNNVFDSNGYTVVFHGNGGYLAGDMQTDTYSQRFNIGESKNLKNNRFRKVFISQDDVDMVFDGWTLSAAPDNSVDAKVFDNMQKVSDTDFLDAARTHADEITYPFSEIKRGTKIHLYALWISYHFTENETIVNMFVQPKQITLAGYGADQTKTLKTIVMANFKDS